MCYPQYCNGAYLSGKSAALYLSKVGPVRVVLHRPLEGTPKTVCIKRSSTGKWYVTIACEWQPTPLAPFYRTGWNRRWPLYICYILDG